MSRLARLWDEYSSRGQNAEEKSVLWNPYKIQACILVDLYLCLRGWFIDDEFGFLGLARFSAFAMVEAVKSN